MGKTQAGANIGKNAKQGRANAQPGWATGLRQLYDSVVDEPLPSSFDDLLSKLDSKN